MMKKRLVILSDLWGAKKNDWLVYYLEKLAPNFDIIYYDCCELGAVKTTDFKEEELHIQFITHGIDIAVEKLIKLEPDEIDILAFSIGGTIAWKAALKGLAVKKMYAVSSTRLRYEFDKPSCDIKLIYGRNDSFIPSLEWLKKMNISYDIINDVGHELYCENSFSLVVCDEIKCKCP